MLGRGVLQAPAARLGVLVHIVILYLAEIPVIRVHKLAEHLGIAVVGEAHLPDGSGPLFFPQPLHYTQRLQTFPGLYVREHVHQIVIHTVCTQAL